MIELKPCPFCGCHELDVYEESDLQPTAIYCQECPAGVEHTGIDIEILADSWNKRVPPNERL